MVSIFRHRSIAVECPLRRSRADPQRYHLALTIAADDNSDSITTAAGSAQTTGKPASEAVGASYSALAAQGYRTHRASRADAQAATRRGFRATGRSPTGSSLTGRSPNSRPNGSV